MTWLAFAFAFQIGVIPQNSFTMYQYEVKPEYVAEWWSNNSGAIYFTDLQAELIFLDVLFFGGGARFQMHPWNNPQSIFYNFDMGLRYKGIELYYYHSCRHPQMCNAWMYDVISGWEGAYDEIGIKFSGKVDLIKIK